MGNRTKGYLVLQSNSSKSAVIMRRSTSSVLRTTSTIPSCQSLSKRSNCIASGWRNCLISKDNLSKTAKRVLEFSKALGLKNKRSEDGLVRWLREMGERDQAAAGGRGSASRP